VTPGTQVEGVIWTQSSVDESDVDVDEGTPGSFFTRVSGTMTSTGTVSVDVSTSMAQQGLWRCFCEVAQVLQNTSKQCWHSYESRDLSPLRHLAQSKRWHSSQPCITTQRGHNGA
jgi:hypothetical protein